MTNVRAAPTRASSRRSPSYYPPRQDIPCSDTIDSPDVNKYAELNDSTRSRAPRPRAAAVHVIGPLDTPAARRRLRRLGRGLARARLQHRLRPDHAPRAGGIPFGDSAIPSAASRRWCGRCRSPSATARPPRPGRRLRRLRRRRRSERRAHPPDDSIIPRAGQLQVRPGRRRLAADGHLPEPRARPACSLAGDGTACTRCACRSRPSTTRGRPRPRPTWRSTAGRRRGHAALRLARATTAWTAAPPSTRSVYAPARRSRAANFDAGQRVAEGTWPRCRAATWLHPDKPAARDPLLGGRARLRRLPLAGQPVIIQLRPRRAAEGGEVDACFVATAACGSLLARQVGVLRALPRSRAAPPGRSARSSSRPTTPSGRRSPRSSAVATLRALARAASAPVTARRAPLPAP